MAAICPTCRFYDPEPKDLSTEAVTAYGLCRWPLPDLPRVLLGHDLRRAAASLPSRMIPKAGLTERPELWANCDAHVSKAGAA